MRYRKLTSSGDMQFGRSAGDFWYNQPEGVGQSVKTRLLLFSGEWFLDTYEGTPWGGFPLNPLVVEQGQILAEDTEATRDVAILSRVISTEGVLTVMNYNSQFDPDTRQFSVAMYLDTIYGPVTLWIVAAPNSQPVINVVQGQSPPPQQEIRALPKRGQPLPGHIDA